MPAAGWIPADGPAPWGPLGGPGAHGPKAHADVRISNMSLILRHLQTSPALSRTRLARETGLSKATVSTLVAELCSRGLLIEEEPDLSGNVGRPSTGLRTAPRAAAGIGLEISGASLLLSIADLTGEVVLRRSELVGDAGHHPDRMIEHVAAMLSQALDQLTRQGTTVPGIVLAQPGIIDYASNTVRYSSTLEWHDIAVADRVRDAVAHRAGPTKSVPTITLEFVATWNNFFLPLMTINSAELKPVTLGLYGMSTYFNPQYGALLQGALLGVIPLIVLFLGLQRFWQSGLAAGAVKG